MHKRWVSMTSKKRFAHATIEEAKASYRLRKARQIQILAARLEVARIAHTLPFPADT